MEYILHVIAYSLPKPTLLTIMPLKHFTTKLLLSTKAVSHPSSSAPQSHRKDSHHTASSHPPSPKLPPHQLPTTTKSSTERPEKKSLQYQTHSYLQPTY